MRVTGRLEGAPGTSKAYQGMSPPTFPTCEVWHGSLEGGRRCSKLKSFRSSWPALPSISQRQPSLARPSHSAAAVPGSLRVGTLGRPLPWHLSWLPTLVFPPDSVHRCRLTRTPPRRRRDQGWARRPWLRLGFLPLAGEFSCLEMRKWFARIQQRKMCAGASTARSFVSLALQRSSGQSRL